MFIRGLALITFSHCQQLMYSLLLSSKRSIMGARLSWHQPEMEEKDLRLGEISCSMSAKHNALRYILRFVSFSWHYNYAEMLCSNVMCLVWQVWKLTSESDCLSGEKKEVHLSIIKYTSMFSISKTLHFCHHGLSLCWSESLSIGFAYTVFDLKNCSIYTSAGMSSWQYCLLRNN